ncbi:tetratricopeptide (TPR) repeat protein [Parabacteroides sp. PF5-5]|uniref:tetratricopeptide repeat protein n=1 Tax=unclassified Parabacteroides TaxID=2649774 RepID=UPI002475AFF9|nr:MULTISPECIES: tetratricopeptide repeat protein [unclassified Parabacteroides]MDH6306249.1 tetratricopeptide (TPR) repeat protein [Parabacteroides sp. PH5-39]MDH6316959.1 tetratricopeptide (TPR) repeat protein [Parabacteroides sp. PF5-13]MDH6321029.1 tetratricopeptide (TPR) repeat protein [Parabacteroides sp. PH5-13]MDH6324761.1 tetratricopeptide (TPR) repeat protein [Parabacteroides sp. PH5-8]MDH6328144.1 tetratricopeptide (TPR) repeat protein [Parabacteroides sp. PH5-41]
MANFFKSLFSSAKTEETSGTNSKADKKNFEIFKYDGIRAQRIGQTGYAIKCFTEALAIKEDPETMSYLVTAYVGSHEFDEALALTNRLLELEPENISALLTKTNILFMLDKEEEVIPVCLQILEREEDSPAAWYLMGKAKKATKDSLGAIEDLGKAIALKDDFTEAYLLRAEITLEMNRHEEALSDIEKVIELTPEEESVYLLRGKIHEKMANFSAAADDYRQVLELNPFNDDAILHFGTLLINTGKLDDAILFLDEAIELKPDFIQAYKERAKAKELKGNSTGAAEDLQKAAELSPKEEENKKESPKTNFDDMYKGGLY